MFMKTLYCAPELLEKDLSGKKYVVTGANSGIGLATTQQLVKQGAHVVMACRRVEAGTKAQESVAGPGTSEVMALDLGDLSSVRNFAETYMSKHERLDALVNNGGVITNEYKETKDGFETCFGVNHLGHFLLTELLLDVLKSSAPSRIICLSSVSHAGSPAKRPTIEFDDLKWEKRKYDVEGSYAQSKLANVLHARTLAKKLENTGVTAYSVHPGWARSNLASNLLPGWVQNILMVPFSPFIGLMTNFEAAQGSFHCILDDDAPKHNGAYFSQNSILYRDPGCRAGGFPMKSPNPNAEDDELGERLYEVSKKMVGLI